MRTLTLLLCCTFTIQASDELFDAARKGDVAAVKATLDKGVAVDVPWRYGQTALFIAAGRGHAEVVKLLLERGADPNVKDTFYGMTVLDGALQKSDPATVRLLLDKGVKGGDRALVSVAGQGKTSLVKELVGRPEMTPEVLTNALAAAEGGKHVEVVDVLKAAGAKPRTVVTVPAETLSKYAGAFKLGTTELKVEIVDGKLRIGGAGLPMMECRMLSESACEPEKFAGVMSVAFTAEGLEVRQGSSVEKFPRVQAVTK